jgi:dihydroneopterin aldolase
MDSLRVLGLKFAGFHGAREEEKTLLQAFEIDVELITDLSKPSQTDRLEDTVNYSTIVSIVREVVTGESCSLIERLAQKIVDKLKNIIHEGEIVVRVRKPHAPLEVPFDTVEVELRRKCGN